MRALIAVAAALACAGCTLMDLREQDQKLASNCIIEGTVRPEKPSGNSLVVVLVRQEGGEWKLVDHFVRERAGSWAFAAPPGRYGVAAFEDANNDTRFQPAEPTLAVEATPAIECGPG